MFIELAINEAVFNVSVIAALPLYVDEGDPVSPVLMVNALATLPAPPLALSACTALCTYIVPVLT